jgi:hypothetical protein
MLPKLKQNGILLQARIHEYILKAPLEDFLVLKSAFETSIGGLTSKRSFKYDKYTLPDDPQKMWEEVKGKCGHLNILRIFDDGVPVIKDPQVNELLQDHKQILAEYLHTKLKGHPSERKRLSTESDTCIAAKLDYDPDIKDIFENQDHLVSMGIPESLFLRYTEGCVVLYFLVSQESANQLPSILPAHLSKLMSMRILRIGVVGQWEVDVVNCKITFDMNPLTTSKRPSLLAELFRQQTALQSTQDMLESKEKDLQSTAERVEILTSQLQALQKKYNYLKSEQHNIGTSGLTDVGQMQEMVATLETVFASMISKDLEVSSAACGDCMEAIS